ncbi:MAG TPA: hypothetical protein VFM94_07845, partial [Solirubrobacterales bacterium]|nr:hypothetical protein [Solirubrobacterales bacterium]
EADSYPATIAGDRSYTLTTKAGFIQCDEAGWQGELLSRQSDLELDGEYGGCSATALKYPTLAFANSCRNTLHVDSGGPPRVAQLGISCEEGVDTIEFKTYLNKELKTLLCTTKVRPQQGLERVALEGLGTGPERTVSVETEAHGVEYEQSGKGCAKETRTDGSIVSEATLQGTDQSEQQIGLFVGEGG